MPPDTDIACDIVLAYHPPALRWVPTAIDSALNQQNARCIVHVIADAVDPSDQRHIRDLFRDAPNIRFHSNETAIGPYRSLHKVFKHFETDHIAIQDSDDISLPHRIWYSINALRQHDCEIFGGAMENFIDWQSASHGRSTDYMASHSVVMKSGLKTESNPDGVIINATMVIKKDAFQKLNGFADWKLWADFEFSQRAQSAGVQAHVSDAVVILRRIHAGSACQNDREGLGSTSHVEKYKERQARLTRFVPGFDPKQFGSLHRYLQAHE